MGTHIAKTRLGPSTWSVLSFSNDSSMRLGLKNARTLRRTCPFSGNRLKDIFQTVTEFGIR